MQISELISVLQDRLATHGDREVLISYEGVQFPLGPTLIYLAKDGAVHLDGDEGFYKPENAVNPAEGERLPGGNLEAHQPT